LHNHFAGIALYCPIKRRFLLRYFTELSYKGSRYHGWQRQQNALSVQEVLERSFSTVLRHPVEVVGCGRTDTGVHAHRYIAHFETEHAWIADELCYRVNALLPEDVALYRIFPVEQDTHARFSAVARTYRYFIHFRKEPFLSDRSFFYRLKELPDLHLMNHYCNQLLQFSEFSSFEKVGSNNGHSLCQLFHARWERTGHQMVFEIKANRFLRNMVRAITGTCLMVGTGRVGEDDLLKQVAQREIIPLLLTAPAHGLHLWKIDYPSFSTAL
jgi:tRNA pseudouridine38-40 synthase